MQRVLRPLYVFAALTLLFISSSSPASTHKQAHAATRQPVIKAAPYDSTCGPGTWDSCNWSGYIAVNQQLQFHYVQGEWNTPCTSGAIAPYNNASEWVGIGGWYGPLLQVGTQLLPDGQYGVFQELAIDSNSHEYRVSNTELHCGTHIYAEVDYNYVYPGKTHVYIRNADTGQVYDDAFGDNIGPGAPDLNTAEWIDERPSCGIVAGYQGYWALAQFNYTNWRNAKAASNFVNAGISGVGYLVDHYKVGMYDAYGKLLAKPDGLSSPESFINRWYANGDDGLCTS